MIGQGSPTTSGGALMFWGRVAVGRGCRVATALILAIGCTAMAPAETMRLRIAWGGGAEQLWQGRIALSEGLLSEACALGIEADEPGSMWLDQGQLRFRQPSPRTYDGVDVLATASLEAKLLVEIGLVGSLQQSARIEVPLADLVDGYYNTDLDSRGNRLLIRRAPGDKLRVLLKHDALVFSPGEVLRFAVEPHLLAGNSQGRMRISIALVAARNSQELREPDEVVMTLGEKGPIEREVRVPQHEGAYELVLTAQHAPLFRLPQPGRVPIGWSKPLAQRRIQFLVLSPEAAAVPLEATASRSAPLLEIDPTISRWWERLGKLPQWRRASWTWKGPLGNGHASVRQHALGPVVHLAPSQQKGEVPWEAYTLPIEVPGRPHILEIDYPSDVPQTMGISVIEPNAAGAVLPIGLDSGVDVAEPLVGKTRPATWEHHRLVFWPKTKAPVVLITNRRDRAPAVFGKLRVYAVGEHLPRAFAPQGPRPERLLAAYLDRPLLPENFSASEARGPMSDLGVDDWVTFYEAGTRLVEYLNYVGFGGLMVAVLADGSTIYPSRLLAPTPRYDTGTFFETGQDPMRKDVLEMLFRLFDRERLQLIPALEFSAPLPQLAEQVRRGGAEAVGLEWIGPEGRTWLETYPAQRGMAPYYNVLDPRVQEAMLAVVREVVSRYSEHPSLAGIALQLSAYGYAHLPGPDWGLDDVTIARFEQDTKLRVPGSGPDRFAERARFLSTQGSREWLEWRADQLARFYGRVQAELTGVRSDARVYLAGANLFGGEELQRQLQPALPPRLTMGETLLRLGIDGRRYGTDGSLVLLRPERIAPQWSLAQQAVSLELKQMSDIDRYFQDLPVQGSLFFHKPQEARIASFDAKSPFRPTYTWLATHAVPSGSQNRRRFVHSLATLDAHVLVDGGWELPLGQEEALRRLVAVYRQLPAVRFQRWSDPSGASSTQPVTIRFGRHANSTYLYLVNDAPFAATVRVELAAAARGRLEELSGLRQVPPLTQEGGVTAWSLELGPYDLVGVRLGDPEVRIARARVSWPSEVQAALESKIGELGDRAAVLRSPPLLDVLRNPGFEQAPTADGQIPGWAATRQPGAAVALDTAQKQEGMRSAKLASQGPITTLISEPFDPPATGRLTMSLWLRGAEVPQQPPLRLAVVGKHEGQDFLRFAQLGAGQADAPLYGPQWSPVVVQINDLPLEGLSRLHLRFDLLGPGEVWIDDIQLSELAFTKKERVELFKLIAPADVKLQKGEVADCLQVLEGYWPRFLVTYVPLPQGPSVAKPGVVGPASPPKRPHTEPPPRAAGVMERLKKYLPERVRF